ncbi:MAG: hypothetical protein NTY38_18090, partial [Acidobacteria bacterium]|nr:hypothetical protein [Acidobacteriota bacterium]
MRFGLQLRGRSHDRGSWLLLLVLLAVVLAPTACVLWFMNEAMNSQRDVARRKLTEAYRAQLPLAAARLDALQERRSAELESIARERDA